MLYPESLQVTSLTSSFLLFFAIVFVQEACFAIAVLLYYFQLASFCWMLVEGMNLLRGLVKVFRVTSRLRIYCLFAWGESIMAHTSLVCDR